MKDKKWIYYIFFIIIIVIIGQLYSDFYIKYLQAYPYSGMSIMSSLSEFHLKHLLILLIHIFMGMIFALEGFMNNLKAKGKWHIDIKRLVIIGIPLLFLSIEYFNFFILQTFFKNCISVFSLLAPAREPFFRFLLGYVILSSFHKEEHQKDSLNNC